MPRQSVAWYAGSAVAAVLLVLTGPMSAASAGAPTEAPRDSQPTIHGHHQPLVVAHRGASGYAPENTLAAADAAAEGGVRWVEIDVQRTRDGELVIVHDTTLERTTDAAEVFPDRAPWKVADFTAEEISQLDAGSWFDTDFSGEPVPTLDQYLDRLAENHQKLLLEIKSPALYPGIEADILRELGREGWLAPQRARNGLIVQSFSAPSVRTVHELSPRVKTGFLGTPAPADIPAYAEFSDQINPPHASVTEEYVEAVHAFEGPRGKPLEVFTWTVDDVPTAQAVAEMGVDGIISNVPDVVRDALNG